MPHTIALLSPLTAYALLAAWIVVGFGVMVGLLFAVDGWLKLRKAHAAHRELRLSFFRGPG